MKRIIFFILCAVLAPRMAVTAKDPQTVTDVDTNDADMKAAIEKSRGLLPHFWRTFETHKRGESDFCIKMRITGSGQIEHFWLTNLERNNGHIYGTINNDPERVKTVHFGQRVEIPAADITDWMYLREGRMIGNYTFRAMFKLMTPDQVEAFKEKIGEPEEK